MAFDFEVVDIYEKGGELRVVVEHKYGRNNFGFSPDKKKLDPETDEPLFLSEIKRYLSQRYNEENKKTKKVLKEFVGKKFKI